jgi:diaminopimelate epimerase
MLPKVIKHLAVMYPSGNTTAVVFDTDLTNVPRKQLNDAIVDSWKTQFPDKPEIEQCCFITTNKDDTESNVIARMDMFGGEFCGNATRSVIQLMTKGRDTEGKINVSGTNDTLPFEVKNSVITVEIPRSKIRPTYEKVEEGALIHLEGISQLVIEGEASEKFEEGHTLLKSLLSTNKYGLHDEPAVGITYFNLSKNTARFIVWVKEVETVDEETACGSGTSAAGIARAIESGHSVIDLPVKQPSGSDILTSAFLDQSNRHLDSSHISGTVRTLFDGEFKLGCT